MTVGGRARASSVSVLATALLVAACAQDAARSTPAKEKAATTATEAARDVNDNGIPDSSASDTDWPGKMVVTYEDATSPEAIAGRDLIARNHVLEDLADSVNEGLKLPYDVPLNGKQCDVANAFWSDADRSVTICYEDAADALDIYSKAGDADPAKSAVNSEVATFYHETGHMVISLYELPTTGREEDVADQLSAYVLLTPGPDGEIDPDSVQAVKDFAREFQGYSDQKGGVLDDSQLADVHSPDKTRMYNLQCWVYGSDPDANADMVGDELLPEDRADGCDDEYGKLRRAWDTLLGPYLK